MSGISDSFQRPINYLRISVTDRCNLRCIYCSPSGSFHHIPRKEMLTYEEISHIAQTAAELGISKIRLSGGEPLCRADITRLIHILDQIPGLEDISLTTNGILLQQYAAELKQTGLQRVNVSLDTLSRKKYQEITGLDKLDQVIEGINAAGKVGLKPIKINMVVMGGLNDNEVTEFARLTRDEGWNIRFIELMPFGDKHLQFVGLKDILQRLRPLGNLSPCSAPKGNGPAKYYRFDGAKGTLGFITPISEHFCFLCNRLRLTADGKLLPCLMSDNSIDLLPSLRNGVQPKDLKQYINKAIASKPKRHHINKDIHSSKKMSLIGG
ncbi:MAG: GTP 3',8-cyclase MoaA [Chloroflexota bacterium]|nr:GTP 3',8-cyclase MoaA [Chloroflexota bacterium]